MGRSGLKISTLSLGSWVTFSNQLDEDLATDCMKVAREAGVNFFDNAEVYARGKSEEVMGQSLRKLGWRRASYASASSSTRSRPAPSPLGCSAPVSASAARSRATASTGRKSVS